MKDKDYIYFRINFFKSNRTVIGIKLAKLK